MCLDCWRGVGNRRSEWAPYKYEVSHRQTTMPPPASHSSPASTLKSTHSQGLSRVVRALRYSRQGLAAAFRDEAAFRQETAAFAVLGPLTLCLGLDVLQLVVLLGLMMGVLVAELLNSGLEALVDKTTPELHPLAGKAKDCASAAVLLSLVAFVVGWLVLAGPSALELFSRWLG